MAFVHGSADWHARFQQGNQPFQMKEVIVGFLGLVLFWVVMWSLRWYINNPRLLRPNIRQDRLFDFLAGLVSLVVLVLVFTLLVVANDWYFARANNFMSGLHPVVGGFLLIPVYLPWMVVITIGVCALLLHLFGFVHGTSNLGPYDSYRRPDIWR